MTDMGTGGGQTAFDHTLLDQTRRSLVLDGIEGGQSYRV